MTWGTYISAALAQYKRPSTYVPLILLFIAYVISARFGSIVIASGGPSTALIWPPAGIALAMLILYGYRMWPAVFAAAIVTALISGYSPTIAIGSALGNTLQPIIGAYFLRRLNLNPLFSRLRDMFAMMIVAIAVTTVVPTIGMAALALNGGLPTITTWGSWWAGEILSVLIITPFLVRWISHPRIEYKPSEWVELVVSFSALIAINTTLFWTTFQSHISFPLVYLILLPLIWIALRLGPQMMTLALLMTTVIGVLGTIQGHVVNATQPLGQRLFLVEIFIEIIAGIFLILVSLVEERKEAMKEMASHVNQLENALDRIRTEDRAKTEFLAILAHELRNPLAPVLSSLELMKLQNNHTPETSELLNTMDDRVRTMGRILDDLLDISRITQKKFSLEKKAVDLSALINSSVATVDVLMRQRNHSLVVHCPETGIYFDADPVRFEQIIVNLLTNAAKYTEPGGHIVFNAAKEKNILVLRVRDNGIGIQPRMLEHIFEPFIQLENTERTTKSTGLGIGLSLTKQLVDMHGGTIEAHSAGPRLGSEFVVKIPLIVKEAPAARPKVALPEEQKSSTSAFTILVVDDNEPAARGLAKLLEHYNHRVSVALNGRGALNAISHETPDIVLLDIGLPDMDGYAVARLIQRAISPAPVLIALTGYGQLDDKTKSQAAGFSYHLTKPVGIADVQNVLSKIKPSQGRA
ncbi:MAG: Two-component system, NarL family, sensor histidine kinase EvgS [Candidatus Adlerbacteria bacterium]|nr:Two-component system, NarL family, sensor histidine kinase EvgS [Candidatus Adlerbacteria bacterium]